MEGMTVFRVQLKASLFLAAIISFGAPVSASVYVVQFSGSVDQTQGNLASGDIVAEDTIKGSFSFDTDQAQLGSVLTLGGGTSSNYTVPLLNLALSIGSFPALASGGSGSIYYQDNVFGSDAFGFVFGGPGGPFGSTFSNFQIQARGDPSLLDGNGIANGFPFSLSNNSFFGSFSNGTDTTRIYGPLQVTASPESAVPEPATWMMLLLGFGAIGASMRKRRTIGRRTLCGNV